MSSEPFPLVSIVTPCLNPGRRLEACIESVRRQTYPSLEHIVIDGGSTDGTVELLRSADGIRWVSEPDAGQTAAINKGFKMAAGEILSWLNADDELKPYAVQKAVSVLLTRGAGWVYGNIEVVEEGRTHLWISSPWPPRELFRLGKGGAIPQPGSLVTRDALAAVGELDESLELTMDFDLWVRLIDSGIPWAHVDETLATFHLHSASKTGRIGLAAFCMEEARSLRKSGRAGLASLALGRSAAHGALEGNRISPQTLRAEIAAISENNGGLDTGQQVRIRAAARTEAAFLELGTSRVRALRHLLATEPWVVKETRARLLAVLARAARHPEKIFQRHPLS